MTLHGVSLYIPDNHMGFFFTNARVDHVHVDAELGRLFVADIVVNNSSFLAVAVYTPK